MGVTAATTTKPGVGPTHAGPLLVLRLKKKHCGRFALNKPNLVLGRSSKSDIVLDASGGVSRKHAHVLVIDGEVVVEDLGSRNGTYVNGQLVTRRTLRCGDRIAIGHYRLHFRSQAVVERDQRAPRNAMNKLLRKWRRAAVTAADFGCPICHAPVDPGELEATSESATGKYPVLNEDTLIADVIAVASANYARREKFKNRQRQSARLREKLLSGKGKTRCALAARPKMQRVRGPRA